jgi:hypothetical protein
MGFMGRSLYGAVDFLREVTLGARVWILDGLTEAPCAINGERSQPMWSSAQRAANALADGRLAGTGHLVEIAWPQFLAEWAPRIEHAHLRVGLNWSGPDVTGVAWSVRDLISAIDSGEFKGADPRRRSG